MIAVKISIFTNRILKKKITNRNSNLDKTRDIRLGDSDIMEIAVSGVAWEICYTGI